MKSNNQIYKYTPFSKLKGTGVGAVKWTKGFWADNFQLCRDSIIPNMRLALDDPKNAAVMGNFYIAAGLKAGHTGVLTGVMGIATSGWKQLPMSMGLPVIQT